MENRRGLLRQALVSGARDTTEPKTVMAVLEAELEVNVVKPKILGRISPEPASGDRADAAQRASRGGALQFGRAGQAVDEGGERVAKAECGPI